MNAIYPVGQVSRFGGWTIDARAGPTAGIQRAFVSQLSACFGSLVEVGVFGLYAMAWELTSSRGGIAPPAFRFHRERGVALNRLACARLEGRGVRTFCRDHGGDHDNRHYRTALDKDSSHRIQAYQALGESQ